MKITKETIKEIVQELDAIFKKHLVISHDLLGCRYDDSSEERIFEILNYVYCKLLLIEEEMKQQVYDS